VLISKGALIHHSPPYSAEFKNEWHYTSTPSLRLHDVDSDNFASHGNFSSYHHVATSQFIRFLADRLFISAIPSYPFFDISLQNVWTRVFKF
jgi:hypothetical protein